MAVALLKKLAADLKQIIEEDERAGFGGEDRSTEKIEKMLQVIELCKSRESELQTELVDESLIAEMVVCTRLLLVDRSRPVRQQTTRLIRYLSLSETVLRVMNDHNLDVFVIRCLEREDGKYLFERLQSLKWVRHVIDAFPHLATRYMAISLLCISLCEKDDFCKLCLDSLRSLFINNTRLVTEIRGVAHVMDAILQPKMADVSRSLLLTVLYLLDKRPTRRLLRASVDVRRLLSPWHEPFEDKSQKPESGAKKEAKAKSDAKDPVAKQQLAFSILLTMLKSITGVFYLSSQRYCLSSLIGILSLPNEMTTMAWSRHRLFDVLDEIIAPLFGGSNDGSSRSKILDASRGPNLVVNYVALILVALIHNGLIDALIAVGIRSDVDFSPRARLLLARIQYLAARYLPKGLCSQICEMPSVMESAVTFSESSAVADAIAKNVGVGSRDASQGSHEGKEGLTSSRRSLLAAHRRRGSGKEHVKLSEARNFATNMIIELSEAIEDASAAMTGAGVTAGDGSGDLGAMMGSQRVGGGTAEDGGDGEAKSGFGEEEDSGIDANEVCVRLGPFFDINSTFMRYRYTMARDIPALMFESRFVPYHTHQRGIISAEPDYVASGSEAASPSSSSSSALAGLKSSAGGGTHAFSLCEAAKYSSAMADTSLDYFEFHKQQSTGFFSGRDAASSALFVTGDDSRTFSWFSFKSQRKLILDRMKANENASYSTEQISAMLKTTQVTNTKDFVHWNMDEVFHVLNGPLWNKSALAFALKPSIRFVKRLLGYMKPSRTHFCQLKWTRGNIRHAHCAAQLFRLMTSCDEGCKFPFFVELVNEIFDCLKQQLMANLRAAGGGSSMASSMDASLGSGSLMDASSSASSEDRYPHQPMSRSSMSCRLSRVYPILIGILSESERGQKFIESSKLMGFLMQLPRKEEDECGLGKDRLCGPNDYLLRQLACNFDYSREPMLRMLFTSLATKGSFYLTKSLVSHLELLFRAHMPKFDEWSIDVLGVLLNRARKREIALTALRVLEKINVSQSTAKARSFLSDLVNANPTDERVGLCGQFLFLKMLSTPDGFRYLNDSGMLAKYRRMWRFGDIPTPTKHPKRVVGLHRGADAAKKQTVRTAAAAAATATMASKSSSSSSSTPSVPFVEEYTEMLENSLLMAVNRESPHVRQLIEQIESQFTSEASSPVSNVAKWLSLTHHLIHEMRTDEEELYHEYLSQLPWRVYAEVLYPSGEIVQLANECFFDYFHFLPFDQTDTEDLSDFPSPIGPGICAVILDKTGSAVTPFHVDKSAKIQIKIDVGFECLSDFYSEKIRDKTVQLSEAIRINDQCSVVREGQAFFVFEPAPASAVGAKHSRLSRIFISVKSEQKTHSLVRPLPHLYGELVKTREGCDYILKNGDVAHFAQVVAQHCADGHGAVAEASTKSAAIRRGEREALQLRSALWAVGMIGSTSNGFGMLQSLAGADVIQIMADMALHSSTLSIRGTCLYVLGLLSRSVEGMTELRKRGFSFPADNHEFDLAVAVPTDIHSFFRLDDDGGATAKKVDLDRVLFTKIGVSAPPKLCRPTVLRPTDPSELLGERGHTEETILAHISGMSCHVSRQSSAQTLHKLHSTKPSVFANPLLFLEAVKLLSTYYLPLPPKRFVIYSLFDAMPLNRKTMELFNGSISAPSTRSTDFLRIRQWRLDYKTQLAETRKRKKATRVTDKPPMRSVPTVDAWASAMKAGPSFSVAAAARRIVAQTEPDSVGDSIRGINPLESIEEVTD